MATCSFCSSELIKGSGIMYAKKDGTVYFFCSSKCRKNQLGLKREGRRMKWTKSSRLFKEREEKKGREAQKKST
jgi:large subunit ribosomal protein L24e